MKKNFAIRLAPLLVIVAAVAILPNHAGAATKAGARTYRDQTTGDLFLGGNFLELGISKYGFLGSYGPVPDNFFGGTGEHGIALATDPAGFGSRSDMRMDYVIPGTPEYRWTVGYKVSGTPYIGSNSLNSADEDGPESGDHDISRVTVLNQSKNQKMQAQADGTFRSHLKTTQVISFNAGDKYFRNIVTLKNVSSETINSVRFMNSIDPDNTVDIGGEGAYTTHNSIFRTHAAGDDVAAVVADTSNNNNDLVFIANHTRSPIMLVSGDSHAKVNSYDFVDNDPYADDAYDNAPTKGYAYNDDTAIGITFDFGSLSPGQSVTFSYFTSVDNRGGTAAINMIRCGQPTCSIGAPFPNAAP